MANHLIGERVKRRMRAHGYSFITEVATATGLKYTRLCPAITRKGGHPIAMAAIYTLAEVLRDEGETVEDVIRDILAAEGEGTPDTPPEKKTKDTQGPGRRKDSEDHKTGPKRATGRAA